MYFISSIYVMYECHTMSIRVLTIVGDCLIVDLEYLSCVVIWLGYDTLVDLIILIMVDFNLFLSINWLSPYHIVLECHAMIATIVILGVLR